MKRVLLPLIALLCTASAHAIVADKFRCQVQLFEDATGEYSKQEMSFSLPRISTPSPAPATRVTHAYTGPRFELATSKGKIVANLSFGFMNGSRLDAAGSVLETFQWSCIAISANWCAKSPIIGGIHTCPESQLSCAQIVNPNDPFDGWAQVGHAQDGTAFFDEKALVPFSAPITDNTGTSRGTASVSCNFEGTYQ